MRISNLKIAGMIADRGYSFENALIELDTLRPPYVEIQQITESYLKNLINDICYGFDCEKEWD